MYVIFDVKVLFPSFLEVGSKSVRLNQALVLHNGYRTLHLQHRNVRRSILVSMFVLLINVHPPPLLPLTLSS